MKVAFDIDGVLYPWTTASAQAANTRGFHVDTGVDAHLNWNWLHGQIDEDTWQWLWRGPGLQLMFDRPELVYPGANRLLRQLSQLGALAYVTHRPSAASIYTARWVAERRVPFQSLHVLGAQPKSAVLTADTDLFIDDKTENVVEVLANHPTVLVGAPRRPWNTELNETRHGRFLGLYDDPQEVLEWAKQL